MSAAGDTLGATAADPAAAASQPAAAAAAGPAVDAAAEPAAKKVKRNVALHVGYVGTAYTGLQANRELPHLATIEGVLEKAILAAGMITEANFGDFRRTKWTRSSRTDKGVHSLCTVIGLRILMDDTTYHEDPEGICYARAINQHLPEDVRVFCVQRTNKSFNARRWCGSRTYEYYLPAAVLGLDSADGSSAADQARLALLRDVLGCFVGYRAFQNYAGNRRQYVGQKAKAARRRQKREEREAAEAAAAAGDADAEAEGDSTAAADETVTAAAGNGVSIADSSTSASISTSADASSVDVSGAATATGSSTAADTDGDEGGGMDPEEVAQYAAASAVDYEYSGEGPVAPELYFRQQVRFLAEPDPDDPVVKSHYRMMRSFTADDPRPLVPGGVPCLRLEVCGDSFMLHQIRHMVGAAVAVVRGVMPRELIELSLSAPGRVTLPRAPPHTLLLSGSQFSPFPTGWGHDTPLVARWTGERLRMRDDAQAELQEFRQQVFDPALNNVLQHSDWDTWSRKLLPRYYYDPELVGPAVESHTVWFEQLKAKRAAAEVAKAAAAAEAAAAEAAALQEDRDRAAASEAAAKSRELEVAGSKRSCVIM
uniref:Pseudouridine synthase I TruA alpha/beta domain-containing protein n=1 Tax=Tetradesmus obliquus TaxID=3088 RepID=A0A383VE63_TETOB|eukprot:jgi/Sobl393_1/13091/SZX62944.1